MAEKEEKKGINIGEIIGYTLAGFLVVKVGVPLAKEIIGRIQRSWRDYLVAEQQRRRWQVASPNQQVETSPQLASSGETVQASGNQQQPSTASPQPNPKTSQAPTIKREPDLNAFRWLEIIKHPCRVTILGGPGTGKSSLGHAMLELSHWRMSTYIFGFPKGKEHLLPDWIGITEELDKIESDSTILVDESYLLYPSRESSQRGNKLMSQILGLFRQRQHTLIFVAQEGRLLDKNIISSTDVLVFKDPGFLQSKFDRPELRDILSKVKEAFGKIKGDKRAWAYIYCPWFEGLLESPLPSHWTEEISRAYASGFIASAGRVPGSMTREEQKKKAKELYTPGGKYSYGKLAKMFGVSKSLVIKWVKHGQ